MNKLALVDTSILSAIFRTPAVGRGFFKLLVAEKLWCGITVESLLELRADPVTVEKLIPLLQLAPFFICKPLKQIILEESQDCIGDTNPILINFFNKPMREIRGFVSDVSSLVDDEFPAALKDSLLNRLVDMRTNYPPAHGTRYTENEIGTFIEIISTQVVEHYRGTDYFHNHTLHSDTSLYQSVRSKAAIVFWKFYKSMDRKSRNSDILDIQMSYLYPYFQYVITEGNLASDIRQIQRSLGLFPKLEHVLTQRDLKSYG